MKESSNASKVRNAFPKTLIAGGGVSLSRFSFKKLWEYRKIEITPEQESFVKNQPIRELFRKLPYIGRGKLYLIEENGEIRGYIGLWVNPRIKKYVVAPLIIDKSAQGRGLGRAAILGACKMFFDSGAEHVALAVHPENAAAIRLYERLGFEFTGTKWGASDRVMKRANDGAGLGE